MRGNTCAYEFSTSLWCGGILSRILSLFCQFFFHVKLLHAFKAEWLAYPVLLARLSGCCNTRAPLGWWALFLLCSYRGRKNQLLRWERDPRLARERYVVTLAQSFDRVLTWNKPGPGNGEAVGLQASITHQLHIILKQFGMCPQYK